MLPVFRVSRGPVAAGVGRRGDEIIAAILHALGLAIKDAKFGWIALVVGRVNCQHVGLDLLQVWRGVIVAGGIIGIDIIIGVGDEALRQPRLHHLVRLLSRRRDVMEALGAAAGRKV